MIIILDNQIGKINIDSTIFNGDLTDDVSVVIVQRMQFAVSCERRVQLIAHKNARFLAIFYI